MSMELMVKAFKLQVGNPLRKLVLIKLADNANDKGECWPSYQHIADQCEIGRSTVKSHVRALEAMGMLTREFRKKGELNQSNLFQLNLDNPVPLPISGSGAGSDLGLNLPEVGQELSEGGAGAVRGGGAGADPRTSHSFEPVNEPVIEPKYNGSSDNDCEKKRSSKENYSNEFEQAWQTYPKRSGGNPKPSAYKSWNARLKEGVSEIVMLNGVKRYAAYVQATGNAGTQYVKQASTFFGPDRHFEETWQAPASNAGSRRTALPVSGFTGQNYGDTNTSF